MRETFNWRSACVIALLLAAASCSDTLEVQNDSPDGQCFVSCVGKVCGSDRCGGVCGVCDPGFVCSAAFQCVPPGTDDDVIGPDGAVDATGDSLDEWHPTGEAYVPPEVENPEADSDNDGLKDGIDNCPYDYNPSQLNNDGDAGGDACDPDDDNDGTKDEVDCDPKDPYIGPEMPEKCDGKDNNCDGQIDEEGAQGCLPGYKDLDGDGFGSYETKTCVCEDMPAGYVVKFGDCNEQDPNISPGAAEICDDIDNDCDGAVDEGCDEDGDGWCNKYLPVVGFPNTCPFGPGDCYDGSDQVNPATLEDSGDGMDNDCDGETDEAASCPGVCTGHTMDAYLCALEMCFGPSLISSQIYSPTGDDISSSWEAVSHFGNPGNDLAPMAGTSYALLASGPAAGTSHTTDLPGGGGAADPYATDGYTTYDNVEFKVVLTAPAKAIGFSIDYVFFSEEYEEWIGTSFNDKFYIFLTAPQTTLGQKKVINWTACSDPGGYKDFTDNQGQPWCYIAINTAYSEPCSNPSTDISGTGFECGAPDAMHGSSTGWLYTSWPIAPGETFELVFHIHDSSDGIYDSEVILDNFHWLSTPFTPGTASHD